MTNALDTLAKLARRKAEAAAQAMRPVREAIVALHNEGLLSHSVQAIEHEAAKRLTDPRDMPYVLTYIDKMQRQQVEREAKIRALEAELVPLRAAVVSAWQDEERYRELAKITRDKAKAERADKEAAELSEAALLKALRTS
jgi:hypothetical protein